MVNAAEIRTLLVTPDLWLVTNFMNVSRELGIDAERSGKADGVPEELGRTKYEAVLVDFDNILDTSSILARVRASPANKNAVFSRSHLAPRESKRSSRAPTLSLSGHWIQKRFDEFCMPHTI